MSTLPNQQKNAIAPAQEGEGERCQKCGHGNPSWAAPSPLWNAVMRGGSIDGDPLFGDLVCASCFMELAEQGGIASNWRVHAQKVDVPLETTTPSGRVWDAEQFLWVHPDETTPAPTVDETERLRGIVSGLRGALEHLENANEALASKRSQATYLAMEAEARDELIMLDEARRNARNALSDRPQAEGTHD